MDFDNNYYETIMKQITNMWVTRISKRPAESQKALFCLTIE